MAATSCWIRVNIQTSAHQGSIMTERWWDEESKEEPPNSKELVEDALNNAEAERIEREQEIAEAKHELELARMEAEKRRLSESGPSPRDSERGPSEDEKGSPEPPVVSASSGVLGLWWLTRGEAIFVTCATVFAVVISVIWTVGLINESTYVEVSATIVSEEDSFWIAGEAEITGDGTNGTGWFMDDLSGWYEDCWTDEEGYEYCDSYYVEEYECYADLYLTWNVNGTEYNDWAYTPSILTSYGCLEIMERHYQIGDSVPIYYANSEPSQFQVFTIRLGNSDASTYWTEVMFHYVDGPNLMADYECAAILTVTYLDPSDNTSQITTRLLDGWDGPASFNTLSGDSCIVEIMNEYSDGKTILIVVDEDDTSKAYQPGNTPEGFFSVTWFCCLGLMVILVIFSFVWVRLSNTPPGSYVTRNGVVHHGGYDGNDVTIINNHYGNRWGYNEGPGVHYRKPSRRFSSRRTRTSGGGSRSSGGHSTRGRSGGGGSSGGGSRSSGGGRSGGGRSGGGRRR